jgi:hypothetical protein
VDVAKTRTTLTIDEDVLRAVKVRAARTGKGDSQVIEEAVRSALGLDLLERLWQRNDLDEDEAMALATEAQQSIRRSASQRKGARTASGRATGRA